MNEILEIKPMQGIGSLKFGASSDEVAKYFGKAEEVEETEAVEEFKTIIWHYWSKGCSVFFDEENNLLFSSIEIDNRSAVLWGKPIFEMKEAEIVKLFKKNGFIEIDSELHEWGERRVSFDDAMVDFYFEDDALTSINYSVSLDEEEAANWPQ